jgi:hypothetical protein
MFGFVEGYTGLTAFLYQRMRDYCIGLTSSRWQAKGATVCGVEIACVRHFEEMPPRLTGRRDLVILARWPRWLWVPCDCRAISTAFRRNP